MGVLFGPRDGQAPSSRADDSSGLWGIGSWRDLITPRAGLGAGVPLVTQDTALRNSAVWACLRLRADLVSTLPLDVYRRIYPAGGPPAGLQVAAPKPPVLVTPGGERVRMVEWMFSTQFDLDRAGNTMGLITARDGNGLPARIDLQPIGHCSVLTKDGQLSAYRIGGKIYDPFDVWHEKQFTVAGFPLGLSPIAYAAMMLGRWQSIQAFAQNWFGGKGIPAARLRNTAKTLNTREATLVKESWRAAVVANEPFVHGSDWEYQLMQGESTGMEWLDAEKASVLDVARYLGCPADLIEAVVTSGSHITYANITQRHLGFLVMHLNPALVRREDSLGTLTAKPRYVKLNRNAFLAMDPQTRAAYYKTMVDARSMTPDEIRDLEDRPPLTEDQIDQFLTFWPPRAAAPGGAGEIGGVGSKPGGGPVIQSSAELDAPAFPGVNIPILPAPVNGRELASLTQ